MINGYDAVATSGYVMMSDKIEAAMKNIKLYLDNVENYDENCELLTKFALPQLEEVKARLLK